MNILETYTLIVDSVRYVFNLCTEALFPSRCEGCGVPGTYLCVSCLSHIQPAETPPFPHTYAVWSYRDTLARTIIWKLKYRNMTAQTKSERLENLKRAFTVPNAARVIGRTIIVVDDVTTTGATFTEARRALTEAGASKVICCAVAH
jgi:predicted amidophosphoribosyltransferase